MIAGGRWLGVALLAGGCVAADVKALRFVEHPYCTISADGRQYRLHHDPVASAALTRAATRWRQKDVRLSSSAAVEFNCLRSVVAALERAGKTAVYAMDD